MTLNKLCTYTRFLLNQAIYPLGVGKLVPAICRSEVYKVHIRRLRSCPGIIINIIVIIIIIIT